MILYNLRSGLGPTIITKFDDDMNVEASYEVSREACTCPAGVRSTCRHRQMLPFLEPKANTDWFYCFDDNTWHRPLSDEDEVEPEGPREDEASTPAEALPSVEEITGEQITFAPMPPLPDGVIVVDLNDPEATVNAIADAVGEPRPGWRRG